MQWACSGCLFALVLATILVTLLAKEAVIEAMGAIMVAGWMEVFRCRTLARIRTLAWTIANRWAASQIVVSQWTTAVSQWSYQSLLCHWHLSKCWFRSLLLHLRSPNLLELPQQLHHLQRRHNQPQSLKCKLSHNQKLALTNRQSKKLRKNPNSNSLSRTKLLTKT